MHTQWLVIPCLKPPNNLIPLPLKPSHSFILFLLNIHCTFKQVQLLLLTLLVSVNDRQSHKTNRSLISLQYDRIGVPSLFWKNYFKIIHFFTKVQVYTPNIDLKNTPFCKLLKIFIPLKVWSWVCQICNSLKLV